MESFFLAMPINTSHSVGITDVTPARLSSGSNFQRIAEDLLLAGNGVRHLYICDFIKFPNP